MSGGITATSLASYAALAGTAMSVVSALSSGSQQAQASRDQAQASRAQGDRDRAMGEYQQRQAEADASVATSQAMLQAKQIRAAGDRQRSAARADLASSGVVVGVGTSELIDKSINQNSEQDALASIYEGDTRANQIRQTGTIANYNGSMSGAAAYTRADNLEKAGKNAEKAGYLNAGASALSLVGQSARGWGSKSDPIGDFYQRGTRGSGD